MYELYQNLVPPFIIKRIINSQFYENSIKTMKGVLNVDNDYNYSNYALRSWRP